MKLYKKVLLIFLTVLPVILTAIAVMFILPDTVPVHFGADGIANRWGSKYESFILPGFVLLFGLLYLVIRLVVKTASSAEKSRTERNLGVTDTVIILTLVIFNALDAVILLLMNRAFSLRDPEGLAAIILSIVIGIVFILLGNIMPKTKRNSFIGMRLKFTMDTDEHWAIANRAGGVAMIVSGLITIAAGLIFRNITYVFIMCGALFITLTVAIIYSYAKIKKENEQ